MYNILENFSKITNDRLTKTAHGITGILYRYPLTFHKIKESNNVAFLQGNARIQYTSSIPDYVNSMICPIVKMYL
jgi:hypothetical protein